MPDIKVIKLESDRFIEWDQFVLNSASGSLFQTTQWLTWLGYHPTVFLIEEQNEIIAGVALTNFKKYKVKGYHKAPYTPYNAPILGNAIAKTDKEQQKQRNYIVALLAAIDEAGVVEFNLNLGHFDFLPYIWKGYLTTVRVSYKVTVDMNNVSNYNSTTRNYLNRLTKLVENETLNLEVDKKLDSFFELLETSAKQRNYNPKISHLKKLFNNKAFTNWFCINISYDNKLISGAVIVYDNKCMYNLLNATVIEGVEGEQLSLIKQVNILTMHTALLQAKAQHKDFDFEGSMLQGVEKFYRHFGAVQSPYYRAVKAKNLIYQFLMFGKQFLEFKK